MVKFNEEKLAKLRTFEDHLREKYGAWQCGSQGV